MQQDDEIQQANSEGEPTNSGGAAPEHRRCQYTKADGKGCRDWAIRGQEFCYRHGVFLRGGRGIDVPLLEDESSIVLVLSETLRAAACGLVSVHHGRLLMDGCRLAHTMQMERLKAANVRVRGRQPEVREEKIVEESQKPGAGSGEPGVGSREARAESQEEGILVSRICQQRADVGHPAGAGSEEASQETGAESSEPDALSPEPGGKPGAPPFHGLEENWEGVLAAQAEPLDEQMEEELAVGAR